MKGVAARDGGCFFTHRSLLRYRGLLYASLTTQISGPLFAKRTLFAFLASSYLITGVSIILSRHAHRCRKAYRGSRARSSLGLGNPDPSSAAGANRIERAMPFLPLNNICLALPSKYYFSVTTNGALTTKNGGAKPMLGVPVVMVMFLVGRLPSAGICTTWLNVGVSKANF